MKQTTFLRKYLKRLLTINKRDTLACIRNGVKINQPSAYYDFVLSLKPETLLTISLEFKLCGKTDHIFS